MNDGKIKWCIDQTKGIRIIELKPHLSESYIKEADETLENMLVAKGKWKIIMAYYACYNALYSILMKAGIKCEIHDCTLEIMELFGFSPAEIDFLIGLKDDRIRAQYYLKDVVLKDEDSVKRFVLKSKSLLSDLNSEKIELIRKKIKSFK
jgi:uncharacterized protein (UPF0332 family)